MIYLAKFFGHYRDNPVTRVLDVYCYGENEELAKLDLHSRYHVDRLYRITQCDVKMISDCPTNSYVYNVENGRLGSLCYIVSHDDMHTMCRIYGILTPIENDTLVVVGL